MKTRNDLLPNGPRLGRGGKGFALVITVSLLVLLTLLALGMLTLSTITLRQSDSMSAQQEARANARLALMLAIGEIQRTAGPDTRVTARADILDAKNPPVLGVWKSWEGTDHETTGSFAGRPIAPKYSDNKQPQGGSSRFLTWLTSWNAEISSQNQTVPTTAANAGSVPLLGTGSLGSSAAQANFQISLAPTSIVQTNHKGAMAWWVSGENQKARLPNPANSVYLQNPPSGWTTPENNTPAGWSVNAKTNSTVDTKPFNMDGLLTDPSAVPKITSLKDADFIPQQPASAQKTSQQYYHDLSTTSVGLLTNTATGGWRKDLSLATENSILNNPPSSGLPFFRVAPGQDINYNVPSTADPIPSTSMLYPWAAYRSKENVPIYELGAVCSWANLFNFATLYKQIPDGPGSINSIAYYDADSSGPGVYNYIHKVRVLPVIARMQWIFSHWAGPSSTDAQQIEPRMVLTPIVTIWNPYNVGVIAPALQFSVMRPLPVALQYTVNGIQNTAFNCLQTGSTNNTPALSKISTLTYQINNPINMGPGQTLLFSPKDPAPVWANNNTPVALQQGYRSGGGHYFQVLDSNGKAISLPSSTSPSATIQCNAKFDTEYLDVAKSPGVGIYLDMAPTNTNNRYLAYRMIYPSALANVVYPPINTLSTATISQALGSPVPFLTTVFGARMASYTYMAAKGFLQSSPFCNYTAMGGKDVAESTIGVHYYGTDHPVNSPFDYSFEAVTGQSSMLPNTNGNGSGFIITGFTAADGLSRCVIDELPVRPLCSLAELQNWDIRYDNPIPPFEFNVIGNSDATPLLPAGAVYNTNTSTASSAVSLQYDDFYCANHLLFDDWFCSSIAPDPTGFGSSNGQSMQNVFISFVTGKAPLSNRAYKPIAQDTATSAASSSGASTLYNTQVNNNTSWQTIASRIEVEGMFNVNSTSLTAWRALLGHARQQQVAYMNGIGSPVLSSKVDYPFSRFSVSGDSEAATQGSSGLFPDCAQFTGYRVLSEGVIDQLAQNIVAQVRARGPFLSLSEFVNRQLTSASGSSEQLALAGAIQTALNQLASSTSNPYAVLQQNPSYPTSSAPPAIAGNTPEYQFPDAAIGSNGYTSYGVPGWTRQADVLRPIAPILSVRDDTFTIRCYGDSRDASGNIKARATCEAVVRRVRDFIDPKDSADITTMPTSTVNQLFGRRLQIISFRWLNSNEI